MASCVRGYGWPPDKCKKMHGNIPFVGMQQETVTWYHCRSLEGKVAQEVEQLEFLRFSASAKAKEDKKAAAN